MERYQTMVMGAAFRRTGNHELARDVTQEVFTTLTRKASSLLTRESIGGWLHQTTVHIASRAVTSEFRRYHRQNRFGEETIESLSNSRTAGDADRFAILDEVLDSLSQADRDVLVLHYFQEQSYREMAETLGISEATVRQRVCRAVDRLGKGLRDRGVAASAVAALLGACAIQSSVAAPAGLATAALAAAGSGVAATIFSAVTAVLSPIVAKVAATVVVSAATVALWQPARAIVSALPVQVEHAGSTALTASEASPVDRLGRQPVTSAQVLPSPVMANLPAAGPAQNPVVAKHVASASTGSYRPPTAVPISTPQLPKPAVAVSRPPAAPQKSTSQDTAVSSVKPGVQQKPLDVSPDYSTSAIDLPAVAEIADRLQQVELDPDRAAELYADLLDQTLTLQPEALQQVEDVLRKHFEDLNLAGLAGAKPSDVPEVDWREARVQAVDSVVEGVTQVLSDVTEVVPDLTALHTVLDLSNQGSAPMPSSDPKTAPTEKTSLVSAVEGDVVSTVKKVGGLLGLPLLR